MLLEQPAESFYNHYQRPFSQVEQQRSPKMAEATPNI